MVYMAITRQQLELESCSNPLKTHEVLQFRLKKIQCGLLAFLAMFT